MTLLLNEDIEGQMVQWKLESEESAEWLRVMITLAEGPGLIFCTQMVAYKEG